MTTTDRKASRDDPTRNERQRLFSARRKAKREGKIEVMVGDERFFVPAERVARVVRELLREESR